MEFFNRIGRLLPTNIIRAAVGVAQIGQCPLMEALRTEWIKWLLSPLAEERTLESVATIVSSPLDKAQKLRHCGHSITVVTRTRIELGIFRPSVMSNK